MSWDTLYEAPEPGVGLELSQFAFEEASGRQEVIEELKKLAVGLQKLSDQAHKDSKDVLDYLWLSVCEVADEVDQVNRCLGVLRDDVSDAATPLRKLHNIDSLAEGVVKALGCVGAGQLGEMGNAITKLDTGLSYVTDLMGDVDEDHCVAATYALSKANKMARRIGLLEVSAAAPPHVNTVNSNSLAHDTLILDSFGVPVASMAELWRVVLELKASNLALTTHCQS